MSNVIDGLADVAGDHMPCSKTITLLMSVGRARRRRENFAVLCFRIQSKTVIFSGFGVILSAFLKGFQSFWNSKS